MARNRGKRPGTSSGPRSQNSDQAQKADPTKSGAGDKPSDNVVPPNSLSASQLSKVDGKPAGDVSKSRSASATTVSGSTSGSAVAKAPSSAKADNQPIAGAGSVPRSNADTAKQLDAAKNPIATTAGASSSASTSPSLSPVTGGSSDSRSFWPGLLGGLIGGAAMALLTPLFWGSGDDGDAVIQLQSTMAELDSRLSATENQVEEVSSLADRVAVVEAAPALNDAGSSKLAERLSDLEQQLGALGDGSSISSEASTGSAAGNAAIDERLSALEQQLSELSSTVTSSFEVQQTAGETLAALQTALPKLEATLSATGATVEETGQKTEVLSESVDTLRQTTERLSVDLGGLSDRVGGAENKLDYIGGEYQRAAAMVVAIGDIDRSIAKAEPYETALESLRALGQDAPDVNDALATLQPMAAEGVPTVIGLKASFGEVGSRILLAEDGDETLVDQVSDNLFGIINMRPAGAEVEGDDSRAVVARAQAKLSADDLKGAIAELEGLNEAAAESAGDWVADAKARLSADAAIADLRAHAQSLLAKGS